MDRAGGHDQRIRYATRHSPEAPLLRGNMCPACAARGRKHPMYEHFDQTGTMYTCPRGNGGCGARYWVDVEDAL